MTQPVQIASILGMIFTLLISFGLPIALMFLAGKKLKADWITVLIGAGTFAVFAMILEKVVFNGIVITLVGIDKIQSNIWIYALFGGLEAGVFEEVGRFVSMKFLMKNKLKKQNSLMFGIGHGGIEAIIIVGLSMISNLLISVMINTGTFETTLSLLDDATRAETLSQVSQLWATPSGYFFLSGLERIATITVHICFSYIVYRSVSDKKPLLLCLAILLHTLIDFGTLILSRYTSLGATECFIVGGALLIAIFTFFAYKNETAKNKIENHSQI